MFKALFAWFLLMTAATALLIAWLVEGQHVPR